MGVANPSTQPRRNPSLERTCHGAFEPVAKDILLRRTPVGCRRILSGPPLGYEGNFSPHERRGPPTKPKRNVTFRSMRFGSLWSILDSVLEEKSESAGRRDQHR